jgi:hypothetical protein
MDVQALALKERACDPAARIPTSRWPFYGTTLTRLVPAGSPPSQEFVYEAERDVLFVDMSVYAYSLDLGVEVPVAVRVSIEYCNTTYMQEVDGGNLRYCCSGKVPILLGVRENKKLRIVVDLDPAIIGEGDVRVEVSLNGYQGNGCCG